MRWFLLVALLLACGGKAPNPAPPAVAGYPRLAVYRADGTPLDMSQAHALARFDLVILDVGQQDSSLEVLRRIKALHPSVLLMAYVNACEINPKERWEGTFRGDLVRRVAPEWILRDEGARPLSGWPGLLVMNAGDRCPPVDGLTWGAFLAAHIADRLNPLWDGVLLDQLNDFVTWGDRSVSGLDIDGDGRVDARDKADRHWIEGNKAFLSALASKRPDLILLSNGSARPYARWIRGDMVEVLRPARWAEDMKKYLSWAKFGLLQGVGTATDYQTARFTLASALLGDGYAAVGDGPEHVSAIWWFDEYDDAGRARGYLGQPRGPARFAGGHWRRDFERGIVLCNPSSASRHVELERPYRRVRNRHSADAESKQPFVWVDLPPYDGAILVQP